MKDFAIFLIILMIVGLVALGIFVYKTVHQQLPDGVTNSVEYKGILPILKEKNLVIHVWCYDDPENSSNCLAVAYDKKESYTDAKLHWLEGGHTIPEALGLLRVDILTTKPTPTIDNKETFSGFIE